ncbi:MAG: T9SS type A sorting domain-containing protein [Bacteroidetes bacterium]|nr:T9SS type A sorting domain-containing protein [Bacteroidota bacterium]
MKMRRLLYFLCIAIFTHLEGWSQNGLTKLDINPGLDNSSPLFITAFSNSIGSKICCFANSNNNKGYELYTTDGNATPTMVYDLNTGSAGCTYPTYLNPRIVVGTKFYFSGNNGISGDELFMYNGATSPTLAADIESGTGSSFPDNYTVLSNVLYFRASTTGYGYELWQYNPTSTLAARITDINPGQDSSLNGDVLAFNGKIYFTADSGQNNNELYVYDPVSANINMVADIYPGLQGSFPQGLTVIGGKMYFTADNGSNGRELYAFDGIAAPTRITDVVAGFLSGLPYVEEPILAKYGSKLYFNARDSNTNQYHLFSYSLSTGNTLLEGKTNGNGDSDPRWLIPYGNKLYFSAYNDTTGIELWSYDSVNAPKMVLDLCPGTGSSTPSQLVAVGNDLFFRANDCNGVGDELFRFNYTEVSVQNTRFEGEVKAYPVPVKNTLHIGITTRKAENLSILITDITGKEVYRTSALPYGAGTHDIAIPVNRWTSGAYFYHLYNASGSQYAAGKITVQ